MARIRSIKPELFKDEELAELGPFAQVLFMGLFTLADRRGRLEDRPKRIKIETLPYFDVDIETLLQQLHDAGFIVRYQVGNIRVIQIRTFEQHQRITGKEAETESEFPGPYTENHLVIDSESPEEPQGHNKDESFFYPGNNGETTETTGKEGKGKERIKEEEKDARDDLKVFDRPPTGIEVQEFFERLGWSPDVSRHEAERFLSWGNTCSWKTPGGNRIRNWQEKAKTWVPGMGKAVVDPPPQGPMETAVSDVLSRFRALGGKVGKDIALPAYSAALEREGMTPEVISRYADSALRNITWLPPAWGLADLIKPLVPDSKVLKVIDHDDEREKEIAERNLETYGDLKASQKRRREFWEKKGVEFEEGVAV